MEQILKILTALHDDVDYNHELHLISDHILDSVDIVTLVTDLETEFGIEIGMEYINNEYFESIHTINGMIQEIMKNK